jgi:hypothetical protein
MNASQLIRTIKAHIEKGDKARDKAEQHYIRRWPALEAAQGRAWWHLG